MSIKKKLWTYKRNLMSNINKNTAVGYVRVSTDIQVQEGHSIEAQKRAIFEYCMYKK